MKKIILFLTCALFLSGCGQFLSKNEWIDIVIENPEKLEVFVKYYPIDYNKVSCNKSITYLKSEDWRIMILKNPLISDMFDEKFKIWESCLCLNDKIEIIKKHKKFGEKLQLQNPKDLKNIDSATWGELLISCPSLTKLYDKMKCSMERSKKEWMFLLEHHYESVIDDFIGFGMYEKFNAFEIAVLIRWRPNILDICYNDQDFISYLMSSSRSDFEFTIIGTSLYYHVKNSSNKKAFTLLKKITDVIISRRSPSQGRAGFPCLYYMARCYKEGYCTEKNDDISNSYYLLLNESLGKDETLKNGEVRENWENSYKELRL